MNDLSMYLDSGSGEEEPVSGVWRVKVVLHEGDFVSSIDKQHIVQTPAGLVAFRALGDLLRPAETNTISSGFVRQGE